MLKQERLTPYVAARVLSDMDEHLDGLLPNMLNFLGCDPDKGEYSFICEYGKGHENCSAPCRYLLTDVNGLLQILEMRNKIVKSGAVPMDALSTTKIHVLAGAMKEFRKSYNKIAAGLYTVLDGVYSVFLPENYQEYLLRTMFFPKSRVGMKAGIFNEGELSKMTGAPLNRNHHFLDWAHRKLSEIKPILRGEVSKGLEDGSIKNDIVSTHSEIVSDISKELMSWYDDDPRIKKVENLAKKFYALANDVLRAEKRKKGKVEDNTIYEKVVVGAFPLTTFAHISDPYRRLAILENREKSLAGSVKLLRRKKISIDENLELAEKGIGAGDKYLRESVGKIDDYGEMIRFAGQIGQNIESEREDIRMNGTARSKWRFQPKSVIKWIESANGREISEDLKRRWKISKKLRNLEKRLDETRIELNSGMFSTATKSVPIEIAVEAEPQKAGMVALDKYLV